MALPQAVFVQSFALSPTLSQTERWSTSVGPFVVVSFSIHTVNLSVFHSFLGDYTGPGLLNKSFFSSLCVLCLFPSLLAFRDKTWHSSCLSSHVFYYQGLKQLVKLCACKTVFKCFQVFFWPLCVIVWLSATRFVFLFTCEFICIPPWVMQQQQAVVVLYTVDLW